MTCDCRRKARVPSLMVGARPDPGGRGGRGPGLAPNRTNRKSEIACCHAPPGSPLHPCPTSPHAPPPPISCLATRNSQLESQHPPHATRVAERTPSPAAAGEWAGGEGLPSGALRTSPVVGWAAAGLDRLRTNRSLSGRGSRAGAGAAWAGVTSQRAMTVAPLGEGIVPRAPRCRSLYVVGSGEDGWGAGGQRPLPSGEDDEAAAAGGVDPGA